MMKLYTADLSPYSARVRMQIYAKGMRDIVFEPPGEHWGLPKFRERFPIGRVPVLDIGGDTIPESEVIAEYLEEICPEPSLLGATPRETAHIRTLARIGDIYLINNMFMLARLTGALGSQTPTAARDNAVSDQLAGEVVRNLRALDKFIGTDGFACCGRITLADCALVPGFFLVESVQGQTAAIDHAITSVDGQQNHRLHLHLGRGKEAPDFIDREQLLALFGFVFT